MYRMTKRCQQLKEREIRAYGEVLLNGCRLGDDISILTRTLFCEEMLYPVRARRKTWKYHTFGPNIWVTDRLRRLVIDHSTLPLLQPPLSLRDLEIYNSVILTLEVPNEGFEPARLRTLAFKDSVISLLRFRGTPTLEVGTLKIGNLFWVPKPMTSLSEKDPVLVIRARTVDLLDCELPQGLTLRFGFEDVTAPINGQKWSWPMNFNPAVLHHQHALLIDPDRLIILADELVAYGMQITSRKDIQDV